MKPINLISLMVLTFFCGVAVAAPANKPNVLVILADDLGYGELGCQGFTRQIPTPHIVQDGRTTSGPKQSNDTSWWSDLAWIRGDAAEGPAAGEAQQPTKNRKKAASKSTVDNKEK